MNYALLYFENLYVIFVWEIKKNYGIKLEFNFFRFSDVHI